MGMNKTVQENKKIFLIVFKNKLQLKLKQLNNIR